jgi:hypothetical protein
MFNFQACYSVNDIIFSVSLFVMILCVILSFAYLMITMITGAILEVHDIKEAKAIRESNINTQ